MNESTGNSARNVASLDDIFSSIILCLVLIFGIVGNLFVVIAILKRRRLVNSNYYYLVPHLAICDLSLLIDCSIPRTYYTSWFSSTSPTISSTLCSDM